MELLLPAFGYGSGAGSWFEPRNASCVNMRTERRPTLPYVERCAKMSNKAACRRLLSLHWWLQGDGLHLF